MSTDEDVRAVFDAYEASYRAECARILKLCVEAEINAEGALMRSLEEALHA